MKCRFTLHILICNYVIYHDYYRSVSPFGPFSHSPFSIILKHYVRKNGVGTVSRKSISSCKELLYFYETAGVDAALSETSVNHFAAARQDALPQQQSPAPTKNPATAAATAPVAAQFRRQKLATQIPGDSQVASAREAAHNAQTLEELKAQLEAFDGCPLKFTAKSTCFADGTPGSALMLIGEAPGRDEDIQGLPFVGRSGQLLNRMLTAIGLERKQVYIANTIPWRPPGNRTPTPMESELCRPFIDRQIELAQPEILAALGGPAAKSLTGAKEGILRLRGNWRVYRTAGDMEIPVMPTLHPAYLLRTPSQKKLAWNDFLMVKMRLKEPAETLR